MWWMVDEVGGGRTVQEVKLVSSRVMEIWDFLLRSRLQLQ